MEGCRSSDLAEKNRDRPSKWQVQKGGVWGMGLGLGLRNNYSRTAEYSSCLMHDICHVLVRGMADREHLYSYSYSYSYSFISFPFPNFLRALGNLVFPDIWASSAYPVPIIVHLPLPRFLLDSIVSNFFLEFYCTVLSQSPSFGLWMHSSFFTFCPNVMSLYHRGNPQSQDRDEVRLHIHATPMHKEQYHYTDPLANHVAHRIFVM